MAANPERGEVDIVINEKTYTLKLSTNAAAILEARLKKKVGELLDEAAALNFTAIRDLVWLLLQKHHGEDFKKVEAAGDLIDDAGGVAVFFSTLKTLAAANAPENRADGGAERPQEAQAGAGESST